MLSHDYVKGRKMGQGNTRYGRVTQTLHWATAIPVVVAYIYGPGGSEQRVYSIARRARSAYFFARRLPSSSAASIACPSA